MSDITLIRMQRLSLCLHLKSIRYKDSNELRIFITTRFTRYIKRQEKELHRTDSQKIATIIFTSSFMLLKGKGRQGPQVNSSSASRLVIWSYIHLFHVESPQVSKLYSNKAYHLHASAGQIPTGTHTGTKRGRTSKVSGKANLTTSYEEWGQHQIKSRRSHWRVGSGKQDGEGRPHSQTPAVPTAGEGTRPSQIQRSRQQRQTDKWETKGTLRLWEVVLEQKKEVKTQRLCYFLHCVQKASSKPMTKSGKGRKLMSNKENQAEEKHALVWEPMPEHTHLSCLSELCKSHLSLD